MTSNHGKSVSFLYELPGAVTSPRDSTRNTSKMNPRETRAERAMRLRIEWPHDRQPPEDYSSSSNGSSNSKKGKSRPSQESVPDSHPDDEVVKSSLPSSPEQTPKRSKLTIVRQVTQPVVVPTVGGDSKSQNAKDILRIDKSINELEKRIFEATGRKNQIEMDIANQYMRMTFISDELMSLQRAVLVLRAERHALNESP
jgi:hypothetical protein